jgi:predicted nucleotidyltransferase
MNLEKSYQTVDELRKSSSIIFECLAGSRMYGLHTPESDSDIRGLFILPKSWHLSILYSPKDDEVSSDHQDIKFFELKKFIKLAADCNPNIIEMLYPPEDCVLTMSPQTERLIANRQMFVSKKAFDTFSGYATSQIKKAKGQNKMVHDEGRYEPGIELLRDYYIKGWLTSKWLDKTFANNVVMSILKEVTVPLVALHQVPTDELMTKFLLNPDIARLQRPKRSDFCWFIPASSMGRTQWKLYKDMGEAIGDFPARPVPLNETNVDLSRCHAAALEHTRDIYRLYYYRDDAKGVFRGDDLLFSESIPIDDEWSKFIGLLVYNQDAFNCALRDWDQYFEWRANRNEARWSGKDGVNFDFDHKNIMHCMRLLLSGENILRHGEPIVRFEGEQLEYLRGIRSGKFKYEDIMGEVERRMTDLAQVKETSCLPEDSDLKAINELYLDIIEDLDAGRSRASLY